MEELAEFSVALTKDDGRANENDVSYVGKRDAVKNCLRKNVFLIAVLCCAVFGFVIGFGLRRLGELSDPALMWLGLPGEIFMRTLKVIILPLLVACVITGSASLDPKTNGKVTMATLLYVLVMNAAGVIIGLAVFYIIRPYSATTEQFAKSGNCFGRDVKLSTGDIFADLIRNLFPDNMITAGFQKTQTHYKRIEIRPECDSNNTTQEYVRTIGSSSGINVLGVIFFCLAFGVACGKVGEKARPILDFFAAASDVILMMLTWVVWLTPIGVLSLIATSIVKANNIAATLANLALFAVTVITAVSFIIVVVVPVMYFALIRKNPFAFLLHALRPMMAGFAPPSSAIAIPEVIHVAEKVYGIDPVISRFCTLFGASTCRCGSGAFIMACSLFLTYMDGISLGAGQVIYMVILTTAVTFAIPAVPSSSIICVIIILSALNVLPTNIGMIMALEWLLDRVRTTSNVLVNLFGNLVINKIFG